MGANPGDWFFVAHQSNDLNGFHQLSNQAIFYLFPGLLLVKLSRGLWSGGVSGHILSVCVEIST